MTYKPKFLPEEKGLQYNSTGNNSQLCHLNMNIISRLTQWSHKYERWSETYVIKLKTCS